ncbi:hypothetical protein I862_02715 [endosymbiont of Acanthamoeba sp. UWC8]|uniref:hypothetical protein n=1 Tax=endosymbiont of Acanthamoeba sp. UWC8 TaxID=86106 RepID=UPI0004D1F73B|nr:hypothetical protein [endosymbiont of Acanthamoeba sp. UWC8]AIF81106.1 hypothetical protein I862_02715 [endosymbiont of Acanthamoeba sp. UWC8]
MIEFIIFVISFVGAIYTYKFYSSWYLLRLQEGYSNSKLDQIINLFVFKYRFARNNNIIFHINSSSEYNFTLKRETRLDKFFKLIKVSRELQIGNKEFDKKIYIVSNDLTLYQLLLKNAVFQTQVLELFSTGINFIHCRNKKLWAIGRENDLGTKDDKNTIMLKLKELDKSMERAMLPNFKADNKYNSMVNLFHINFVCFFICYALVILAMIESKEDCSSLLEDSLGHSLKLFSVYLIAIVFYFFRTSQAHIVYIHALMVSLHVFMLGIYSVTDFINIHLDKSSKQIYYAKVVEKKITGKKDKYYYISIPHWNKNKDLYTTSVSAAEFERVKEGSAIELTLRSGYLGYEWIENKEVIIK